MENNIQPVNSTTEKFGQIEEVKAEMQPQAEQKYIDTLDLSSLREIAEDEGKLHQRIVQNRYNQLALKQDEENLDNQIAIVSAKRKKMEAILQEKYGNITSLNLKTGTFQVAEDTPEYSQMQQNMQIPLPPQQ